MASTPSSRGSQTDCSMVPGTAMIQPGINRLTFRALPLKRGLYTLKHADASLGCLSLHIPVLPTSPSELSLRTSSEPLVAQSIAGSEATSSGAATLGTVLNTGEIQQETIVLNVHSCIQRIAVSAAALRGALVAGQPQWLAMAIMPLHDSLHDACIHVGMVSNARSGSDQADNAALSASLGSRSSTASTSSPPDDASPTHLPGLVILHPDRAIVAPLRADPLPQSSRSSKGQADKGSRLAPESTAGVPANPLQTELPQEQAPVNSHRAEQESETGTSDLRYDAGPEASVSGSSWVSLEGSLGPNLPPWTATQPSVLWVWVQPGSLPIQHETVRVIPMSSRGYGRTGADEIAAFSSPRAACTQPSSNVDVQVNLEYLHGCQRAHAAWLTIPVTPPFRIHTTARELPNKRMAIQLTVTSNLPWAATLTALTLTPQHGFRLDPPNGPTGNLCPVVLTPGATASAIMFVTSRMGGRSASRSNMLRGGAGQVCSVEVQYKVGDQSLPAASVSEVVPEWGKRLLDETSVPLPPRGPPVQRGKDETPDLSVRHTFSLVMAPVEGTPRSTVYIRLLGPFSARQVNAFRLCHSMHWVNRLPCSVRPLHGLCRALGEPVTLCWRLERSQADSVSQDSNTIQYDVHAAVEGWRPMGMRAGCVGLSAEGGTATVEASWVPIIAGTLPAPELHLRDVSHQEAFDTGANTEFINVLPLWIKDIEAYTPGSKVDYPIISDPKREIAVLYGMLDPDEMDKTGIPLTARAVFIVGPDKKLKLSILYPATTGRNFSEVLRVIDSLQLTAKYSVATPVNWQHGDKVMVTPNLSDEQAKEKFSKGFEKKEVPSGKGYIRLTPQPNA
ncbi:MAG: peroxiredoxin 6 [Trebouxia sp. A1-2]|nr:MAG: peroxiredoxin 6 [Trebouxia sp. A1-2]